MPDWFNDNEALLWWAGSASAITFVATLVTVPLLIVRMPSDYFLHKEPPEGSWRDEHPVARILVVVLKNVVGAILVLAGLAMLVLPGQGVLTIVIGITLLNFPGKRSLELWIIRRRSVLRSINWMRRKARRPPLALPDGEEK